MSKTKNLQEQEGWKNQERAYEQGLLAGYTKSIILIRNLQRGCEYPSLQRAKLEQAMESIMKEIESNNNGF